MGLKRVSFILAFLCTMSAHAAVLTSIEGLGVDLMQSQYLTESSYSYQSEQYTDSKLSYYDIGETFSGRDSYVVDFNVVLPFAEYTKAGLYFPQSYYTYRPLKNVEISLGRKLYQWSYADQKAQLGIWEPLFRWDQARPITQGLTGVFFHARNRFFEFSLFASPIFLPDQQPEVIEENGELKSSSRWFRAPISTLEFQNSNIDLKYKLNKPDADDVIFNDSYALSFLFKDQANDGPWLRASVAQKPMNQFHLGIDTENAFNINANDFTADVYPIVVNHSVGTIEGGFESEKTRAVVSYTQERFKDPNLPDRWEETELIDSNYLAAFFENMIVRYRGLPIWARLGYLEKNISQLGSEATRIEGDVNASTQRLSFEKWIFISIEAPIRIYGTGRLNNKVTYHRSPVDDSDWLAGDIEYQPKSNISYYLSFDVFGSGADEVNNPSFISLYRNNDRVFGGLRYVF